MAGTQRGHSADETALLAAARDGDSKAFGLLYRRYLPDVRAYCGRRVGDSGRAEDLAQETFVRAFQRIRGFRLGTDFWPWLQVIARNLCIDEARSSRHRREIVQPASEPRLDAMSRVDSTSEAVIAGQRQERTRLLLASAFTSLSSSQRLLLWQHDVEEMTYEEIAQARSMTIAALRNSAWRARCLLREAMGEAGSQLRRWIFVPLIVTARSLKRWLDRRRPRIPLVMREEAFAAFLESAVVLAVSAVILGSSWAAPYGEVATVPRLLEASQVTESRKIVRQPSNPEASPTPPRPVAELTEPMLTADIHSSPPREQGAAPSQVNWRVEVRDSDGEVLYWEETDIECGPGRSVEAIPDEGPVRAYC